MKATRLTMKIRRKEKRNSRLEDKATSDAIPVNVGQVPLKPFPNYKSSSYRPYHDGPVESHLVGW